MDFVKVAIDSGGQRQSSLVETLYPWRPIDFVPAGSGPHEQAVCMPGRTCIHIPDFSNGILIQQFCVLFDTCFHEWHEFPYRPLEHLTYPFPHPSISPSPSLSVSLSVSVTGSVTWADCQCARCQLLPALGMWWAALYLRETDASDHLLGGLVWTGRAKNGRRPAGFFFSSFYSKVRVIQKSVRTHRHILVHTHSKALVPQSKDWW